MALVDSVYRGSIYYGKEDFPGWAILGADQISDIPDLDYHLVIIDTRLICQTVKGTIPVFGFCIGANQGWFFDVMAIFLFCWYSV